MTGLYLHIPFCVNKCHYCNFVITRKTTPSKEARFLDLLFREADLYQDRFKRISFETLYLGGGTPSALSARDLARVFTGIRSRFRFKRGAEITCEVNPGDITRQKARQLKDSGVTRISFGVQSFHEKTLKNLNRAHGVREIYSSYACLRKEGFKNINMDLILSLPGESLEDVRYSLKELAGLAPEHVSLYELTIEDKTVFGKRHEKGKLLLPEESIQLEMLKTSRQFLKDQGYDHYELLNYARKGFRSRHNLIYWRNGDYLGLGPGAFSYFGGKRFQYASSFEEYLSKVSRKEWAPAEEESLPDGKKNVESLLLALRLTRGASKARFLKTAELLKKEILSLKEKGLLSEDKKNIFLTPRGQLFAETVFSELSSPQSS